MMGENMMGGHGIGMFFMGVFWLVGLAIFAALALWLFNRLKK